MELLERDTFLSSLTSYADEARAGQGRTVLIAGEAGVGKTALLEAFRDLLPQATWAWGACDGLFTPRPLAPVYDVARELGGPLLAACQNGAGRDELFDAFLSSLLDGSDLTVVVVEDVHWADEASLDLLRHVARRLTSSRSLLLVTYRDDELSDDSLLRTALGDLAGYRGTRRIMLPTLSADAVARLCRTSPLEPGMVYRLTGGNPYFLSEVLAGDGAQLPPSARDAVLARAGRLDPAARAALGATALVGVHARPALLRTLPDVTGEALDACVAAGLLVARDGLLAFRHDLARLAVAAAVPPERRTRLHAAIVGCLLASGCEDHAQLAYHAEESGDSIAVLQHAPAAALAASKVASHREAASQYARALRHADDLDPRGHAELFERLADETALVDRWEECTDARFKALAIWRELGDDLRSGDALRLLVAPLWRLCRGAEAEQAADEAVALLDQLPPGPELARAWSSLAYGTWNRGDTTEALRLARLARGLAHDLGVTDCLSDALNTEACILMSLGEEAIDGLKASLDVALAGGHEAQVGRAFSNLYSSLTTQWRLPEAERVFVDATAYSDTHDLATFSTCLRGQRSWSLRQQGRTVNAIDVAEDLLATQLPSPVNSLNPLTSAGVLRARTGDQAGAWAALDEAAGLAKSLGEAGWASLVEVARAESFWLGGRDAEAASSARAASTILEAPDRWERGEAAVWLDRLGMADAGIVLTAAQVAAPYALELAGDRRGAADEWDRLGAGYQAALALVFSPHEADVREALERFTAMEAPAAAGRARQRLRGLGADAVPAGPRATTRAHPAGLTRRETEVLGLLARGLANADIAAELFLSERTVEHHVSAVLGKLGVTSRGDAAREAERRELLDPASK